MTIIQVVRDMPVKARRNLSDDADQDTYLSGERLGKIWLVGSFEGDYVARDEVVNNYWREL